MALHDSLFGVKEGKKTTLLLQIYPIVLMMFLFDTYLGVRQKTAVLCFALCLKLD